MSTNKKSPAKGKKVDSDDDDGTVRIRPDLEKYKPGQSASGKKTQNCGDAVAVECDGMDLDELIMVAESAGVDEDLAKKYSHLNMGQQIMCVRNKIRGLFNAQDKAHVADKTVPTGVVALDNWVAKAGKIRDKRFTVIAKEAAAKAKEKEAAAKAKEKAEAAKAKEKEAKAKAKEAAAKAKSGKKKTA